LNHRLLEAEFTGGELWAVARASAAGTCTSGSTRTSKVRSNHDSSLLRGSFLAVQLMRQYPESQFEQAKRDSSAFRAMRAMGPVKIE